ncbi:MAG: S9 family peptidase [Bacteroidetes bacterium]|nr:S9 family peptidase [Bacteroidota bacterium]
MNGICSRKLTLIRIISISLVFIFSNNLSFAQDSAKISIEDVWGRYQFGAKSIRGLNFLNDGTHYASTKSSDGLRDILKYDLETGDVKDTIFKGSWLIPPDSTSPVRFSSYTFSSDEKSILFSTNVKRIYRRSTTANYYIWNSETKKVSDVSTREEQRLASLTDDATRVAFVSENDIYYTDLETGKETQITDDGMFNEIINGATDWVYEEEFSFSKAYAWSPDGKKIAYYRFDESDVVEFTMSIFGSLYPVNNTFKYPKAGEDNALLTIHVYDLNTGTTTEMDIGTETDQYIPRIKWTNDPNTLCIYRMNRHQNKLELLMTNATTGKSKVVLTDENKYYIDITDDLTFLEDNKRFIWSSESDGYNHLYLYKMNGDPICQITKGKWEVMSFYGLDEVNSIIYFQSTDDSPMDRQVYSIGLNGKGKKELSSSDGSNRAVFNKTFSRFINYHSDANTPSLITLHSSDGTLIRVMEDNSTLKEKMEGYSFGKKEFFQFKTSNKDKLNGWMMKPADFDSSKEYPVLMYVYGGPGSQTVRDSWGGTYYFWFQYLLDLGYIVVSVDNRGTGARGEEFKKMTYLELGKYETIDQIEAAKYLGSLKYIDASRIGIFGWSYGGYMAALCITKGADVFSTAISVAPVSNWRYYDTIYTERFMRTPQENPNGYDDNSPINFVDMLKGNFLLIHGMADDNVHFQNSTEMVIALVAANKQFEQGFYPDKNHGISGGNTRLHLFTKITDFILENL